MISERGIRAIKIHGEALQINLDDYAMPNAILTLFLIVTLYSKVEFEMSYCGIKPET